MDKAPNDAASAERPAAAPLRGLAPAGIRERNERLVLTLIRRLGPLAKSDIARRTGLSAQAVSVIMRSLEAEGLLVKMEPLRGRVGQPSVPMGLAPDGAFFLGLKVGRRRSETVLLDFTGRIRGRDVTWHDYPTPAGTLAFARRSTAALAAGLPPALRGRIAGLGIGLPFQLWDWAEVLNAPPAEMEPWRDTDLVAELAEGADWTVLLQNDATAACNAELLLGTGQLPRDFLYAYLGFFVGGGLVLNGALFAGRTGNAGALASLPVPGPGGRSRQLLSAASLYELEKRLGREGAFLWDSTENWQVPARILDAWTAAASAGLAHAAVTAAAICDLDAIVIDGWLPAALRDRLVTATNDRILGFDTAGIRRPQAIAGTIGPEARSIGAAALPLAARFVAE